jgi:hypothetical protein
LTHISFANGLWPKNRTLVSVLLLGLQGNVAVSCIIERAGITHFALLSAAGALPPSVNKSKNQQVSHTS